MRDEDPNNVDGDIWEILRAQFALVGLLSNKMPKLIEMTYTFQKKESKQKAQYPALAVVEISAYKPVHSMHFLTASHKLNARKIGVELNLTTVISDFSQ